MPVKSRGRENSGLAVNPPPEGVFLTDAGMEQQTNVRTTSELPLVGGGGQDVGGEVKLREGFLEEAR